MGIGSEVARARQAAGLSHAQLAERTRIRAGIIQSIERDDFDACGGVVYVRGHLRAIARALGVDPTAWLDALGGTGATTHLAQEEPKHLDIWELRDRSSTRSERRSWSLLVVVAVVVIGVFVYVAGRSTDGPELVPSESPTPSASASSTPSSTPAATATPTASVPTVAGAAITLQLDCTSASWVRVTNALGTVFEGTMRNGESQVLTSDTDVTVRVGNAAGIAITVNGQVQPSLGGPGQVYTNTFSL